MFHRQFSSTSHRTVISAPSYYPAEVTLIDCLRVCTTSGLYYRPAVAISPEFSHKMIVECSDSTQFQY